MSQLQGGHDLNPGLNQLEDELQREMTAALGDKSYEQMMQEASGPSAPSGSGASQPQHPQQIMRGRVAAVEGEDVFVNLHGMDGKLQGVVPLEQFERSPKIGCIMDFVMVSVDEAQGLVMLSREGAIGRATWDTLQPGTAVEARVTGTNKGGLELELLGGIRAFMPASQVDLRFIEQLDSYVGQKLQAVVDQIDRRNKNLVLSRRKFLENQRRALREKLWKELEVGQTREGVVTSTTEYGAFVDLGGADGLIHISDLSYQRVEKSEEVVKVGQSVTVKVLKLDPENDRISLGLKQIQPDPWELATERMRPGENVTGKVVRVTDFGAFVEIQPGVEALAPVSELSWKRIGHPSQVVNVGEEKRWLVLEINPEKRRISLSLKQAEGDPWIGAERKFARNSLVEATVLSTTEYGAFVELQSGVEGLVHISELSDKRVNRVEDVLQPGSRHQFRVLEVDEEKRRIRLSLKAVNQPVASGESLAAAPEAPTALGKHKPSKKKPAKPLKGGLE